MESSYKGGGGEGTGCFGCDEDSLLPAPSPYAYRWPPPVQPGETIALAAPASCVAREAWEGGIKVLKDWGFRVQCGPEVFASRGLGQDTDRLLARRFEEIWCDPEVKAVMAVRGGYGSLKLLPHLDLASLKARPKRLVGFSDLTNLLWHLHHSLGLVTFHGPTVAQLAELTDGARHSLFDWLTAPGPRTVAFEALTSLHPGRAEGPLAGGNLTTLCHLVGTPFAPRLGGYLLFLEDHNEARYRLDRMIHQLLLAGVLAGVKGVVLGAFTGCGTTEGLLEVFKSALEPLGVPVLAGLPVGHQPDNHTLPLGAWARLDAGEASLTLLGK
ncbi:MAG: LD-carboxypeptidase [Deltaproteobacteria bacterium]|nr:LD-carboxypeptidase [Deltaproteobacteria bacterium]